jgi:hypothetical protein
MQVLSRDSSQPPLWNLNPNLWYSSLYGEQGDSGGLLGERWTKSFSHFHRAP